MSSDTMLTEKDIEQIKAREMDLETVHAQLDRFSKGFPYARLKRSCTLTDGIVAISEESKDDLINLGAEASLQGRITKMVPASGAASRMFKLLLSAKDRFESLSMDSIREKANSGDTDFEDLLKFVDGLPQFAFYDELLQALAKAGYSTDELPPNGDLKPVLEAVLMSSGLNYSNLPKGLILFHQYPDNPRTAFQEHLVEALAYAQDEQSHARVHFTVSSDHLPRIQAHIDSVRSQFEKGNTKLEVTFSTQKPSTDTIAATMENRPFRDPHGELVFRPGGHGALLENLNDLKGDIIIIKNIDNIVPDRIKEDTYTYKKLLTGYLVSLQNRIFTYLEKLSEGDVEQESLSEMTEFATDKLSLCLPTEFDKLSSAEKAKSLFEKLNRPIRICGMVKNIGAPGGGPFWVEGPKNETSIQIVESSQVDMSSTEQKTIWESSTHFNPVDLVCGVHDFQGNAFDLIPFRDPNTGFISNKSKEGKELKALELPGLWNGAMAMWNTVFVEVPISTFSPVKTVMDLLKEEHQPRLRS